jgi:hypothetical protein
VNDGQEVFGELLGVVNLRSRRRIHIVRVVVNDQLDSASPEYDLEEVDGEPGEPIPVGDNNLRDHSLDASFHQGAKTGAVEVNSRSDIFDHFSSGIALRKERNLSIQVCLLFPRRYAAINDLISLRGMDPKFDGMKCAAVIESAAGGGTAAIGERVADGDGGEVVQADPGRQAKSLDDTLALPRPQSDRGYAQCLGSLVGGKEHAGASGSGMERRLPEDEKLRVEKSG